MVETPYIYILFAAYFQNYCFVIAPKQMMVLK